MKLLTAFNRVTGRIPAAAAAALGLAVAIPRSGAADVTFPPGAYIIDMGQPLQNAANGLKPYGLVYDLVVNHQVPVSWSINPNKITDKNPVVTVEGTDFTVSGKPYRGGPFIIPAVFVDAAVSNVIATWRAKGVIVDGPISKSVTAPIYNQISSFPTALLDISTGGDLVTAFYEPAEIPAVTYHFGGPRNLDICDDLYGMPENDPHHWDAATRAQFHAFILHGGSLWTSCRTVSSLEALPPTYCGFNFLSATSLIPAAKHYNNNRVPFAYNTNAPSIWADPLMQFMGKVDNALKGGSEELYVPDSRGWAPHARVAVFDQFYADAGQPWISHVNPQLAAADIVFGRAYNNPSYGLIMYVSSCNVQADGTAQNTAVARTYGNMLLRTGIERRPHVVVSVPLSLQAGSETAVNASITGGSGPYTIQWSSSSGTFADPDAATTTFTVFPSANLGAAVIRATVTDTCQRKVFDVEIFNVLPATGPAVHKTALWNNAPGPVQPGDQINYQIKLDHSTNGVPFLAPKVSDFLPPTTAYLPGSATPPLSSGPDPLLWTLPSSIPRVEAFVGTVKTNILFTTVEAFDTYIDNFNRTRNFGGASILVVGGNATKERRALVRFDLRAIPTNATILKAELILTKTFGNAGGPRQIAVHRLTNDWTENTLINVDGSANWSTRRTGTNWIQGGGDFIVPAESTNSVGTANGPYSWNLTRAIRDALNAPGPQTTNGFLVRYDSDKPSNDSISFGSSENVATNGPRLVIAYSVDVTTSTRLTATPYDLIGSQSALPTLDLIMEVFVTANSSNFTVTPPPTLTVQASSGATVALQAGFPSPASAIVPTGGGKVQFTYKYNVTGLGTAPGTLRFVGHPSDNAGTPYTDAFSDAILTVPTMSYSVLVNAPLPAAVQRIPNTAMFSDDAAFAVGVNAIVSPPVYVAVNNTNPVIGIAKAVNSIINHGNGTYTVAFDLAVTNLGTVTVSNVQVGDDLSRAFSGRPLTGVSVTTTANLAANPTYDGVNNTNLLAGTNVLGVGTGGLIHLTATVTPGSTLAYTNQASASATDISGTSFTSDRSDDGTNPDSNENGDPSEDGENDPTPVVFTEAPVLSMTKSVVSSAKIADGAFSVGYEIVIENPGDVNLSGLQVNDRLASAFPPPAVVTVNSLSSPDFVVNGAYNGGSDSNLLAAAQTLAVGGQGVINLAVTVTKNGSPWATFTNLAAARATSPAGQPLTNTSTATAILEAPALVVTKQVTALFPNVTNFSVAMRIDAVNVGDVTLKDIQLVDDLAVAFGDARSFAVTSLSATNLTVNTNFDGVLAPNLLVGTNSLSVGATGSVFLTVSVVPGLESAFANRAVGIGTSTNLNGQTLVSASEPAPITPSTVDGTLFLDRNADGVFDAGDQILPHVNIAVTTASNITATISSDALGNFHAVVPAGSTTLNVDELDPQFPTNAILTVGTTDPSTVNVPAQTTVTVNKGYVLPAGFGIVNGYVFLDNDVDGVFDDSGVFGLPRFEHGPIDFDEDGLFEVGDAPITNINVRVVNRNNVTNLVVTDTHGYYLHVVPEGQALLEVVTNGPGFPAAKVLTINDFNNGSNPTLVTVPEGGIAADNTGFITPKADTGLVIGNVFLDVNTNGVFDVADQTVADIPVVITDVDGEATTVFTDPGGFFSVIVRPGPTIVDVVTAGFPTNLTLTVGSTDPTTVNVPDGGMARDNTGYRLLNGLGLVRGYVYVDNDQNGLYEPGVDTPIRNITVTITATNGAVTPLVTDANGYFQFTVTSGITIVSVDTADPDFPAGLRLTTDAQGEGSNPTAVFVPSGSLAQDNTGFTELNLVPLAVNDAATTVRNVPVSGNVLANDELGDLPTSSLTIISNVSHGLASLNLDGSFTYAPGTNYFGPDTFIYQLCDANGDCSTAAVYLSVLSTNTAPLANNDTFTILEDIFLDIPAAGVLTNDVDADGDMLSALLVSPTTNGVLTLNANGSFTYRPNTNYYGTDSFSYRAVDGKATGNVATVTIQITPVNDPPLAVADSTNTLEDVSVTIPVLLNDSDPEGTPLMLTETSTTNGTAVIVGTNVVFTAATNFFGTVVFTYTISDGTNSATANVTVTVTPVNDPPLALADTASTPEDVPVTIPVLLNDGDPEGSPLTITQTSTTNGTAVISGTNVVFTPSTNFYGTVVFTYTISDGTNTATTNVTVTVTPVDDPPLAVDDTASTAEDVPVTIPVLFNDSDPEGTPLTLTETSTTNGTAVIVGTNVVFTAATNFYGTVVFTYTISDGTKSATANVTVTVTPVNDAPLAVADIASTPEDVAVTIPVLLNDSDPEGSPLTITQTTTTNGTAVVSGTNVVFTPSTNFFGTVIFTYTISDGTNTATTNVTVTVTPVNDAPLAVDDTYSTLKNIGMSVSPPGVLGNDTDVENDPLSVVLVSSVTNGTLILNADGSFVYIPASNYVGSDVFTYRARDAGATGNVAVVTINVAPTNTAPTATEQSVVAVESTPKSITLAGIDPDGDTLTFSIATPPANGTLSGFDTNTGAITYTPNPAFLGTDTFTFQAADGMTSSTPATVTVTVTAQTDLAVFMSGDTNGFTGMELNFTITATNLGPSTASNVVVSDLLPAGYTFVSAEPATATVTNNRVQWPAFDLAASADANFSLVVIPTLGGVFTNTASATHSTVDRDRTNNDGSSTNSRVITFVELAADVMVVAAGPAEVTPGETFTYTISVTNLGPAAAADVVVQDQLPTNVVFVSASTGGVLEGNVVSWPPLVSLGSGASASFIITVTAPGGGAFTNIALAAASTVDPDPTNNNGTAQSSQVSTLVTGGQFGVGAYVSELNPQTGLFEQRVSVTNTGPATVAAFRVLVGNINGTNGVPRTNVRLVNATGTNADSRPYVQYNTPLNPGSSVTFTLEFLVPDRKPFTNTIEVVAVLPVRVGSTPAAGVAIDRVFMDGRSGETRFVIEWTSVPGQTYTILYSDVSASGPWSVATPTVTAVNNRVQWYDDGPPKTTSKPASVDGRYYQVIANP